MQVTIDFNLLGNIIITILAILALVFLVLVLVKVNKLLGSAQKVLDKNSNNIDQVIEKLPDLLNNRDTAKEQYDLNDREQQFISLVANGLNNKEIAETLFLSEGTVRNYLSNLLDKLGLRDRTQLAIFFYQHLK